MSLIRPNILASTGYIPGEQPADTTTIKLNTNENPYPPSPRVIKAILKKGSQATPGEGAH